MVLLRILSNLLGDDVCFEEDTLPACFRPGFLLDCGIYWVQNLRKFLVAGAVVGNSDKIMSHKCDQVCRASELPIYIYHESKIDESALCPPRPSIIERGVSKLRQGLSGAATKITSMGDDCTKAIKEQTEKVDSVFKYLSEECDENTRMGAVGVGALAGFLMGMRRGWFKRILYAGVGGFAMSAVCYPNQTYDYSKQGLHEARKAVIILYNFISGANPDDKQSLPLFKLPELPGTLDEAWQKVSELSKSTSSLLIADKTPPPKTDDNKKSTE